MSTSQSPLTAISSSSSLSLKSTQIPSPVLPKQHFPAWMLASPSDSSTSPNSRRICRICQMHDGEMVRPCDCAGTMGDVHEECLTKWVNMSKKYNCEICKSAYSKSGEQFKPIHKWSRPQFDARLTTHLVLLTVFALLIIYVITVMLERHFYERVFRRSIPVRPDDTGRISLIFIFSFAIVNNVYTMCIEAIHYLKRQRQIRFVNKHS
uniref:RING-CH-type domain-containing protein n=1 Tax=Caenorhabditis japonica TaxID=281687 RepID=A0A8R1E4X3_CAEJA